MDLPYFDVNGDGRLTAADVLAVINHINQGGSGGGGEGEPLTGLAGVTDLGWLPSAERLDGYSLLEPASVPTPARANATPGHEPADNLVFTVPDSENRPRLEIRRVRDTSDWLAPDLIIGGWPLDDMAGVDAYFSALGVV